MYERQKAALAAAAALEATKEAEERGRMVLEEQRSWDAYELNTRNYTRMIEQARARVKALVPGIPVQSLHPSANPFQNTAVWQGTFRR